MRVSRFYIDAPLAQGQQLTLPTNLINYIVNVLRLKSGNEIRLFNGQPIAPAPLKEQQTGEFSATLIEVSKRNAVVQIEHFVPQETESSLKIHLFQGISRSERMDFTIQKAIELGVTHITPVLTQRSNTGKLNAKRLEKKMQHWQGVAISACEQSGRTSLVAINKPVQVEEITSLNAELNLLLSPDAQIKLSNISEKTPASVNLFIGPEGGLNAEEMNWATEHGYQDVTLGSRVLRTETAGLAVISILQFIWGDLS
ncbi:MAG: 16S rRNA (uracil(1498)-N(3))-methyltransferase [Gammaproteobacteria bacterium]|nr:16S rRNA (uracil(1498)-N(3))-methyltransferase [Gammaproteobacteria bacterium]